MLSRKELRSELAAHVGDQPATLAVEIDGRRVRFWNVPAGSVRKASAEGVVLRVLDLAAARS